MTEQKSRARFLLAGIALVAAAVAIVVVFDRGRREERTPPVELAEGDDSAPPAESEKDGDRLEFRSADEARAFVARAKSSLARQPGDARLHRQLGTALSALGERDDALAHYGRAVELAPSDAEAQNDFAVLLAASGQIERAMAHFRAAIRVDPDHAESRVNLGNTLVVQRKFAEAIPHFRRAIAVRPDYAKAHNNLAVALKETGSIDEAHVHLREAMRFRREQAASTSRDSPAVAERREGAEDSADSRRAAERDAEGVAAMTTRRIESERASAATALDPSSDGWESEAVAETAKARLERLAALLSGPGPIDPTSFDGLVSADPESTEFDGKLEEAYRDAVLTVRRRAAPVTKEDRVNRGRASLAKALETLAAPLRGASDVETHVKIVRVDLAGDSVATLAYFDASGRTGAGAVGVRDVWRCRWARENGELLLDSLSSDDYERIDARGSRWFTDCTAAVLGANDSFERQLVPGLNHWLARIERVHSMHVFARYGLAVGDVNGDDLDDVYVCQPGGLPNRLYVQNADGTASDTSAAAGVDWLDHTSSALLVDLDGDGDQDLVAATIFGLILMANDGRGSFARRAVLAPRDIDLHSLSAADYDGDGDLDLYICTDFAQEVARPGAGTGFVYHDANDGGANLLFRNDIASSEDGASVEGGATWSFTDVTKDVGLDVDNRRHSLAAAWEDYDNDGDPDLYVANDYGQNCLYRNDGGRFVNVARQAGVVDFGSGMSVSWADFNRDGRLDIYVGNMFSSAGNRITRQLGFKPGVNETTRELYRRFAKGNSLFENIGGGTFREVGAEAGVEMGRWAWSSVFADINSDGWDDLLVANGYITTEDTGDL